MLTSFYAAVGRLPSHSLVAVCFVALFLGSPAAHAQTVIATVSAGTSPLGIAVNPVTNKIYVANFNSGNVTVIDGATNSTTTVKAGSGPFAVAVNPVTNKIYVANFGIFPASGNVTIIDGATNSTTTVNAGTGPHFIAVNPVTDKIYVANIGGNNVTVIDGVTNSTTTVSVGLGPFSLAVNTVTNKIYVIDQFNNPNVTVIDGITNATTTVNAGSPPDSVDVNSVTNKIYLSSQVSNNVTVIDGATNSITTVNVGSGTESIAVNPVTNKIYVVNYNNVTNQTSNNVTVIDGATNSTATENTGSFPASIAVNPVTNKIYVTNEVSNNVTVIDGSTNCTTTVSVGTTPVGLAVNPITNRIYVANFNSANVTVIDGTPVTFSNPGPNQTVSVGSTVTLDGSGSTNPSGSGALTYSWVFVSIPPGSATVLRRANTAMPTFFVDVPGTYVIALIVTNGCASSTATVTVNTSPGQPIANAGPSQIVPVSSTVFLNGSASTSGTGGTLTYAWTLVTRPTGSTAALTGANTVSPTFVADQAGTYAAQLIVNDGTLSSAPSFVTITTQPPASPISNAGPSQKVKAGSTVTLDGSGSSPSGGGALTYSWVFTSIPPGSMAALRRANTVMPTFFADVPGAYVVALTVTNGAGTSTSSVTITVIP